MRLIDADALNNLLLSCAITDDLFGAGVSRGLEIAQEKIANAPTIDAVPTDFHDRCMQAEIQKRIRLEKIAELLCDGYLDMPSGCDGCPLVDTMVEDDDGNGVCDLYRR